MFIKQETSQIQPPKDDRKRTNYSLLNERDRTDKVLENHSTLIESETDVAMESDRVKADVARLDRRAAEDQTFAETVHSPDNADFAYSRIVEDSAIKAERLAVDTVLEHERSRKKNDMHNLLNHLRKETDRDLLTERQESDTATEHSIYNLAAEQIAHASTKAELTTHEEFLAIVSHDLRNPIGAISSCTEMLLDDPSTIENNADFKHWMEFIKRNADASLRLINDILDMERIVEGKLSLQTSMHCLSDIVMEAIENHKLVAESHSLSLRASPTMLPNIVAIIDKDRITQVLSNLIGNAIKFTPAGGTITLDLQIVENRLQVSVKDTGPGISEFQKNHIFKRFAQIDNKDRRGLGLGLYISMMFVELHGGQIGVYSRAGEGSTFYFTLPKSMS